MNYSFQDVVAAIAGPGIAASLGSGAAVAEEGIDIQAMEDKNVMQVGADGKAQHSLIANDAGTVTIRLLKNSPLNAQLMLAYEFQSTSSALWGRNVLTVANPTNGDVTTIQQAAFKKKPDLSYKKEAGIIEWVFDAGKINTILGASQIDV